jgi:hypothetical protein
LPPDALEALLEEAEGASVVLAVGPAA